jgi:hypothetical protein
LLLHIQLDDLDDITIAQEPSPAHDDLFSRFQPTAKLDEITLHTTGIDPTL